MAVILSTSEHVTLTADEGVEREMRTANLIAYVSMLDSQYAAAAGLPGEWDWTTHADSLARREDAQQQIRERLGLGQ